MQVGAFSWGTELGRSWDSRGEPQQAGNISLAAVDGIQGLEGILQGHEKGLMSK